MKPPAGGSFFITPSSGVLHAFACRRLARRAVAGAPRPPAPKGCVLKPAPVPRHGLRHSGRGLKPAIFCRLPRGGGSAGWVRAESPPPRRRVPRRPRSFVACPTRPAPPPRPPSSAAPAFPPPRYRMFRAHQKNLNNMEPFLLRNPLFHIIKIFLICEHGMQRTFNHYR